MFLLAVLLLIVIALLFVLPPLLRKPLQDSDNGEAANLAAARQQIEDIDTELEYSLIAGEQLTSIREEAENTLIMELGSMDSSPKPEKSKRFYLFSTLIMSLFIPVSALLIYLSVGSPGALLSGAQQGEVAQSEPNLEELVSKLEQRLADKPADQQGWLVLAQTNMMMQRFPEAVKAMERLYQLTGDTPDVLARYADTLAMANSGRFNDKAGQLIDRALELDPDHVHALWLAGARAYQAEEFETAVKFFQKARPNITDENNLAQIDGLIKAASERSGMGTEHTAPGGAGISLLVNVDIAPELKDKIDPQQTLFIFAKAASGPPMPLAVSKHKASELPITVSLDDSMAMMSEMTLSGFDEVIVSARISKSDEPIAQAGDLQGESAIINPSHETHVDISINRIVE